MTSRQKAKGNAWENAICKYLGELLNGNFMRVPNSGAYMGGANAHRKSYMSDGQQRAAKGDIIPPDHLPKLNIEAKNYADIAFHQIIDGKCAQLNTWLEQTEMPADPDDVSFTIFKITRKGSWVAFRRELLASFSVQSHVVYYRTDTDVYIVTDYESFFANNKAAVLELGANGKLTPTV